MHKSQAELDASIDYIANSPKAQGTVDYIVCRPAEGHRQTLTEARLDVERGLVGDTWFSRGDRRRADGSANPDKQLNIINSRAISAIAGSKQRWSLAGDQLYVDLDLSDDNLPPGTQLQLGDATIVVTAEPHLGCHKFRERFGKDAVLFVNSKQGKALKLRGINARITRSGVVKLGDTVVKL